MNRSHYATDNVVMKCRRMDERKKKQGKLLKNRFSIIFNVRKAERI